MLRARALEQALRMLIDAAVQTACKIAEDGDRRWHVVDLVCATNDAEKLLAVDPPPSGASPQATGGYIHHSITDWIPTPECDCDRCTSARKSAPKPTGGASPQAETSTNVRALTVHICEDCLNLRGEMCHEPGCRFCRRTMAEVAEYLDVLLIRPRIDGVSVLVDEGAPLPAPVSPVEPTTCPKCRSNTRAYRLAVADVIDGRMAGMTSCRDEWHSRMPMVSPVEPEPTTTCRCLDCEPLTDPGPKPSEDDINRLEKAAWDSKTDLVLVWYRDRAEMFRQRLRETERAWQLDRKKPTVELEPCVWRESGNRLTKAPCFDSPWFGRHAVAAWKVCPYCGAPLKVER